MQPIITISHFQSKSKKNCLIIGKGPSFSTLTPKMLSNYTTIALNHVIREGAFDIAHLIDFDVFEECQEDIYRNAKYLWLPWVPHVNNSAGIFTLDDYLIKHPILKKLAEEKRLFWYNLETAKRAKKPVNPLAPIIKAGSFSASTIVNLLATHDVKNIYSIGVDGGNTYNLTFNDLTEKTLLSNGLVSFNQQFREINRTTLKYKISYQSLAIESPVKVYIGSSSDQWLAHQVLSYSIKKNASTEVVTYPLYQNNIKLKLPKDKANQPRTPFSFQRFLIPELNQFKGKAIYLDSDMLVFSDIVNLWNRDIDQSEIFSAYSSSQEGRIPQFSVLLINCKKFKYTLSEIIQLLDDGILDYESLMYDMKIAKQLEINIEPEWNSLEKYEQQKTKLLHYTDMTRQPWIHNTNPLGKLWVKELANAITDKVISKKELRTEIIKGNVKPSLIFQINYNYFDVTNLPLIVKYLDKLYTPPYLIGGRLYRLQQLLNILSFLGISCINFCLIIPLEIKKFIYSVKHKIKMTGLLPKRFFKSNHI